MIWGSHYGYLLDPILMDKEVILNIINSLENIYISPLEMCNLKCKICYTRKTDKVLNLKEIKDFTTNYQAALASANRIVNKEYKYQTQRKLKVKSITLCGGEVFLLEYLAELLEFFYSNDIFVQIVTNGTLGGIKHIRNKGNVCLMVSLDGLEEFHDENRGKGNFAKSIAFIKRARKLGFHTEIFSIVNKSNYHTIKKFETFIRRYLGRNEYITYLPRKSKAFLNYHPISNRKSCGDNLGYLSDGEYKQLVSNYKTLPSKDLGCYQISLMSTGKIYGCCEGTKSIGKLGDNLEIVIRKYLEVLSKMNLSFDYGKLGCFEPDFICGLKKKNSG